MKSEDTPLEQIERSLAALKALLTRAAIPVRGTEQHTTQEADK